MPNQPTAPIKSPAAWRGEELSGRDDWLYRLSSAENDELINAMQHAKATGKALLDLTTEDFPLTHMTKTIAGWLDQIENGYGFIQIKGFPAADFTEAENALVYWGIGQHMGTPVSQNADGDLLGHVRDTGDDPDDPNIRLYKTRVRQDFHADGSDIIGLMCLHPSKSGGESQLVSSVSIFNEILRTRPNLAPLLFENFQFDRHGQESAGEKPYWSMPISTYEDGHLKTWFAEWYIRQAQRHADVPRLTSEQDELVSLYAQIANDPRIHINIDFEVGDIQFLKNSAILHARGEYEDYPEAARKRHLLRLWLARKTFAGGIEGLKSGVKVKA